MGHLSGYYSIICLIKLERQVCVCECVCVCLCVSIHFLKRLKIHYVRKCSIKISRDHTKVNFFYSCLSPAFMRKSNILYKLRFTSRQSRDKTSYNLRCTINGISSFSSHNFLYIDIATEMSWNFYINCVR
jgi:hypothetical protein